MSGPIIRKYGFPNHDKIFGEHPFSTGSMIPSSRARTPRSPATDKAKKKAPAKAKESKPKK